MVSWEYSYTAAHNPNNDVAALNSLQALIHATRAQRGKKIPEAEADAIIDAAEQIIALFGAA